MNKPKPPLLQPKHFAGLTTQLTDKGLRYETFVGQDFWKATCLQIGGNYDLDEYFNKIAASRPQSKVVLNPNRPNAKFLLEQMKAAQSATTKESINIHYAFPIPYETHWKRLLTDEGDSEWQKIILVVFNSGKAVGFSNIEIALNRDSIKNCIRLSFYLHLIYVAPQHRGRGFGLDLSAACCEIGGDILTATYCAAPPNHAISILIDADYESKGGESLAENFHSFLETQVDDLKEYGRLFVV
jgi:GNAT superfamily N-acetyltransferase